MEKNYDSVVPLNLGEDKIFWSEKLTVIDYDT